MEATLRDVPLARSFVSSATCWASSRVGQRTKNLEPAPA